MVKLITILLLLFFFFIIKQTEGKWERERERETLVSVTLVIQRGGLILYLVVPLSHNLLSPSPSVHPTTRETSSDTENVLLDCKHKIEQRYITVLLLKPRTRLDFSGEQQRKGTRDLKWNPDPVVVSQSVLIVHIIGTRCVADERSAD